ncbi:hypothetical protein HELRODRAFT_195080 [Helobdella robusta]|uniref:Kinesin light chain n=1 Tax=Helobdella robusta TaxID=6412 RepID=T1FWQ7_HELRO|nr:hypothetical protein HELRODRAFT_195080 [Helobdella robusta]ESO07458.1 hypothetical protein HELRODRAFT_195080 [Helobdella robusta]
MNNSNNNNVLSKNKDFVMLQCLVRLKHFGKRHPKYADVLLDYGFYMLNVDRVEKSIKIYQMALDIRVAVFGGHNLHVAIAHEDLAYCTYVREYNSGNFQNAREHAEAAINILTRILPRDHLLLASSNRVKALILEEIAIESFPREKEMKLLGEAEELHLDSLHLALKAFGENNVQTAKHYGNLGRLYQSMQKYEMAEQNHLKAIDIKERLLGNEDYEVALSVGHLASLYNYDLNLFDKAECLYLRSIAIGKKLFGEGYSGLEYDYRGLIRLYQVKEDFVKVNRYTSELRNWALIRERQFNDGADDDDDGVYNNSNNNNNNNNNNVNNVNNNNNNINLLNASYNVWHYSLNRNIANNNNNKNNNNNNNNNRNCKNNNNFDHDDDDRNIITELIEQLEASPSFKKVFEKFNNAHLSDVTDTLDDDSSSSSSCCSTVASAREQDMEIYEKRKGHEQLDEQQS